MAAEPRVLCPSADPRGRGAQVFAVVGGSSEAPSATYIDRAIPMTDELRALAGPVDPAEVFRVAAPCAKGACQHFDAPGDACRLAEKTARLAPIVVHKLPACAIRSECRWWHQEGAAACHRCPRVVTMDYAPTSATRAAANPMHRVGPADSPSPRRLELP